MRSVEGLSHRQREITPPAFAEYLVVECRRKFGSNQLAALWVRKDTPYLMIPGVDCWGAIRNAYRYNGPWPVICHPPCGPWGKYRAVSRQDKLAGIIAMVLVDTYGGVVEQPVGSSLFEGGQKVLQSDFGHLAAKATKLYWGVRRGTKRRNEQWDISMMRRPS